MGKTIEEWKSWAKSKTIWVNGVIGALAAVQVFAQPLVEMLPPETALKVLGIILLVNNVVNVALRFATKMGLYTGKYLPGPDKPATVK